MKPIVVADPAETAKPEGWTRFVCFSDTHGKHDKIVEEHMPAADVLLHAGDFTNTGELKQVVSFAAWLESYPAKHKVVIAGNHDITFEPEFYERSWKRWHTEKKSCEEARAALIESSSIYLENQAVEVMGYNIYGTPYQPAFCDWAFNLEGRKALQECWSKIPGEVDILISHGPPYGMGDLCFHGQRVGCPDLLAAIRQRHIPISLAGHIHEGYGVIEDGETMFVNASTCNLQYRAVQGPIVIDVPPPEMLRKSMRKSAEAANVQALDAHLATGSGSGSTDMDEASAEPPLKKLTRKQEIDFRMLKDATTTMDAVKRKLKGSPFAPTGLSDEEQSDYVKALEEALAASNGKGGYCS